MRRATPAVIAHQISGSNITSVKKHRVTFSNRDWLPIDVSEDEAIIDAVEAAGHVLPIACRYGGCITCTARLVTGAVRQPNGTALNKRQSKDGYILLCVAQPKQDCCIEVGVESHDTLYENPFAKPDKKSLEYLKCLQSK